MNTTASRLLVDEEEARCFCRTFLVPYCSPRILQCTARKKYSKGQLSTNALVLERVVVKFDDQNKNSTLGSLSILEDNFIREIKKFEALAAAGLYTDKKYNNNLRISEDWMVIYVTAYPLDEDDASDAFVAKVVEMRKDQRMTLAKAVQNNKLTSQANMPRMQHIHSKLTTCLHSSPCKNYRYLKLDVDTKNPTLIQQLQKSLTGATIIVAVETRGGYHIVFEKGPCCRQLYELERTVNRGVSAQDHWLTIESSNGPMLAVPGTKQGGFTVRLATEEWKVRVQEPSENP